jgi:hypothetical protein
MGIKAELKSQIDTLTGLVSYLGMAPQRTALPFAVIQRIATTQLGDNQAGRSAWNRETFQIDLYGASDAVLEVARNAIIEGIHGQTPTTWGTLDIESVLVEESMDMSELENAAGETQTFRHTIDISICYFSGS